MENVTNAAGIDFDKLSASIDTDPLNEDLSTISTAFPVLQTGQVLEFKVSESEVTTPDDPTKARAWKVTVETLSPAVLHNGDPAPVGHKVFQRCQLAPTGAATVDMVKRGFAVQAALVGAVAQGRNIGNIDSWHLTAKGNTFRAKVGVKPARVDAKTGANYDAANTLTLVK